MKRYRKLRNDTASKDGRSSKPGSGHPSMVESLKYNFY